MNGLDLALKYILQITGPKGEVLAKINSEEEIEIFCTRKELEKAMILPGVNEYYKAACILFKCILFLDEQNRRT